MAGINLVLDKHHKMITTLSDHIGRSIDSEEFKQLKNRFKAALSPLEIKKATNIMEISEELENKGYIEPGKYDYLKEVLKSFNVRLVKDIIEPVEEDIKKMKSTKESTIEPVEEDIKKMKSTKESQLGSDIHVVFSIDTMLCLFPLFVLCVSSLTQSNVRGCRSRFTDDTLCIHHLIFGNGCISGTTTVQKFLQYEPQDKSDLEKPKYDIGITQKGFILIINVKKDREGSENDAETVKNFFENTLNFKVEVEQDLTLDNLRTKLKGVKEQISGEIYCFILLIMGHRNKDGIRTGDHDKKLIKTIIDIYRNKEMQSFLGKPKMVFVQACNMEIVESDLKVNELAIQQDADMLIAYSTTEDYRSFRGTQISAHFIQELLAVIQDYYKALEELLVIVRHRFAAKQKQQIS